ncbi:hypothetical protein HELRODRAFT_162368 [Helobdella robusta]|uniref:Uncharacterized protein n=1 Tax=Helobdella robusta TaxID=6412 RepID=T1ESK7_HELRO|nr:hypothetical protein HELRODRAFT_162368 [Helobdella robusta]ESN98901.1 hypothetical protein HELRODRAFT_162368 [Helobdella robusta]
MTNNANTCLHFFHLFKDAPAEKITICRCEVQIKSTILLSSTHNRPLYIIYQVLYHTHVPSIFLNGKVLTWDNDEMKQDRSSHRMIKSLVNKEIRGVIFVAFLVSNTFYKEFIEIIKNFLKGFYN